jgi:hypothetical protein
MPFGAAAYVILYYDFLEFDLVKRHTPDVVDENIR